MSNHRLLRFTRLALAAGSLLALMATATAADWEPPPPMPDEFDWVQLKSGEWLKGEIKVMYDELLEFESDELDLLKLDMADVKQIRSAQVLNVRLRGDETATGKMLLEDNSLQGARRDSRAVRACRPAERDGRRAEGTQLLERQGIGGWYFPLGQYRRGRRERDNFLPAQDRREPGQSGLPRQFHPHERRREVEQPARHATWDWFFSERVFLRPVFFSLSSDANCR